MQSPAANSTKTSHDTESVAQIWPILVLAGLLFAGFRWLALDVPLERDEGEYAYIAQRVLQGEIPYRDIFNQKPPGVFLLYLLPVGLCGTSVAAIHLTAQLWTAGTAVFLFMLVRELVGLRSASLSLVFFGVLTVCPEWQALAANTEVFMLLPLIAATWCAWRGCNSTWGNGGGRPYVWWFLTGVLSMAACFFKQIAFTNVGFLAVWIFITWRQIPQRSWRDLVAAASWIAGGMLMMGCLVSLLFVALGAGRDYFDCVLWHNFRYAQQNGWSELCQNLSFEFVSQSVSFWGIWVLVLIALLDWRRGQRQLTLFLTAWIIFSFAGAAVGFYFRPHYFVQLAPAFAMACGITLARLIQSLPGSLAGFQKALITILLTIVCLLPWFVPNLDFWFRSDPAWKSRRLYSINPFPESAEFAGHLRRLAKPDETVLIVGSEPQMLFLAERKSATRYILFYPLMMVMPGVQQRQEEAYRDIRVAQPKVVILTQLYASLLMDPKKTPRYLNEEIKK